MPVYNPAYDPSAIVAANPGKRIGELANNEAMLGRLGLLQTIAGGGYMPGQRDQFIGDLNRQLGLQSGTERILLNRRLAATPGTQDTAFGDALSQQFAAQQQNALAGYTSNLDQAGMERQQQALSQLFGAEEANAGRRFEEKQAKRAAIGSGVNSLFSAAGTAIGASSVDFKQNIKDLDPEKIKQFLVSINKIDLKKFRYKPGIDDDGQMEHIGPMAENAPPEVVTPDGKGINMMNMIGLLIGSVQALSKDLELLKKFSGRRKEIESTSIA